MKKNIKRIGLWMDHSEAILINPDELDGKMEVIRADKSRHIRHAGQSASGIKLGNYRSTNNEVSMHNKEQNHLHAFYKELANSVHPYDEILVLGPTTAPSEFHNYMEKEKGLNTKKMEVLHCDYLTENQLQEQVKKFFHV
jgi:hypothetical protein